MARAVMLSLLAFVVAVHGSFAQEQPAGAAPPSGAGAVNEAQQQLQDDVTASGLEALRWLKLVDGGRYAQSWQEGSILLKIKVAGSDWEKMLQKTRSGRGNASQRQLLDHRVSYNPAGLPAGTYMAIFYQTSFSNGGKGRELLTLRKENDGSWKVLTYHVTSEK